MARKWTESDWHKEKLRIAREAAKNRMGKKNFDGKSQMYIDSVEQDLFHQAVDRFNDDFKYESLSDAEKNKISEWKADDADNYLLSGGNEAFKNSFNPLVRKRMDDFAKLGPLVLGLADEGRDWYSMGAEDLFAEGKRLGYDTSTKEGKMDFLRDVGDVQTAHERGKMLEEFNRENSIWSDLFYPTLMEEARKQITTGRGTQRQLDDAKKLDIVMNGLIGAAPLLGDLGAVGKAVQTAAAARKSRPIQALASNPLFKTAEFLDNSPVISASIGAAAQGIAEAERQGFKEQIDPELEADYTNALLALVTGATRPGMIGTAGAFAQQIPGRAPSRFARGIMGATRRGNPTNAEREELGYAFDVYDNLFRNGRKGIRKDAAKDAAEKAILTPENVVDEQIRQLIEGYGTKVKLPELEKAKLAEKLTEKVRAMYGDAADEFLAHGTKDKLMADYDDIANMFVHRNPNNFYKKVIDDYELVNGKVKPGNYLAGLEQAFPSKMAEAYGNDKVYKAGIRTGELLGTLGGSIEPMLKVNPFGPLSGGRMNIVNTDYKGTNWYKSLSKRQQEAFDDAYEKAKKNKDSE